MLGVRVAWYFEDGRDRDGRRALRYDMKTGPGRLIRAGRLADEATGEMVTNRHNKPL